MFAPARAVPSQRRCDVDTIVLFRSTDGSVTVDFAIIEPQPGRAVRIRPGQVIAERDLPEDAVVVTSASPIPRSPDWFPGDPAHVDLDVDDWSTALRLADAIQRHEDRSDDTAASRRLLADLFGALAALTDAAHCCARSTELPEAYRAFRIAIEMDLSHRHDVAGLANELGYSARTLSRACQVVTGRTAKQILTDRLVLEAKRRLAHSRSTSTTISNELGFSEPTNFTKFFVRNTGSAPTAFRDSFA